MEQMKVRDGEGEYDKVDESDQRRQQVIRKERHKFARDCMGSKGASEAGEREATGKTDEAEE